MRGGRSSGSNITAIATATATSSICCGNARGLANQGWKDSYDAIFHRDGQLRARPIALAEVQGYVYAACTTVSGVAARLGHLEIAERLGRAASALKRIFERDFWLDEKG